MWKVPSPYFSTLDEARMHSVRSIVTSDSDAYFHAMALQMDWPVIPIFTALFGILTVCTGTSLVILMRRGLNAARLGLLLCILTMYGGTATYWVLTLHSYSLHISSTTARIVAASLDPSSLVYTREWHAIDWKIIGTDPSDAAMRPQDLQMCAGTAALLVNITLGDGIVWWRAWVVCARKTWVLCLAALLLLSTSVSFVLTVAYVHMCVDGRPFYLAAVGVTETAETCSDIHSFVFTIGARTHVYAVNGGFFVGNFFGFVSSMVTLLTNVAATTIIGYQAWVHSRLAREFRLNLLPSRVGVHALLALLVESGILYCVLWVLVVAFLTLLTIAAFDTQTLPVADIETHAAYFWFFLYLIEGALVPLIAIYPTVIIILVTLGNSCFEAAAAAHPHGTGVSLPLFIPSESTGAATATDGSQSPGACPDRFERAEEESHARDE
ncbi:hypothetical protein GSI_12473 [Ganoderma sinense ZZ0214-1]|uniref:Uncharacterized protein n=1 Tax=Ganoderma sinense ZZ0214-1 TaxID=1077348 RepID=A0A2G8RSV2_9APHY|nr:hypothetical protein GSI_12473 [Ganoderma sinense ZZ0214-1]